MSNPPRTHKHGGAPPIAGCPISPDRRGGWRHGMPQKPILPPPENPQRLSTPPPTLKPTQTVDSTRNKNLKILQGSCILIPRQVHTLCRSNKEVSLSPIDPVSICRVCARSVPVSGMYPPHVLFHRASDAKVNKMPTAYTTRYPYQKRPTAPGEAENDRSTFPSSPVLSLQTTHS